MQVIRLILQEKKGCLQDIRIKKHPSSYATAAFAVVA
jgi:hypothetical protein